MLFIEKFKHEAAEKIYQAIVASTSGAKVLLPILRPFDTLGSTRYVDFDTARDVYRTRPDKCHISHVVLDSGWEAKLAETLEEMDEVICYAKNFQLGFTIPYTLDGQEHAYLPDYLIALDDGHGPDDRLQPDPGSQRRAEEGKGGQGFHGAQPVGASSQQPRRLWALGLHRDRGSVGCEKYHPGVLAGQSE